MLTAVRSSISHELIPLSLPTGCCCVATTIQSNKPFVIVNAYNPPSGSNQRWQPSIFESILCQVKSSNSKLPVIQTGDLNLSGVNWEDNSTNSDYELKCIDFFMEHNLHQLNHSITTASKTLDLCLTDNPELVIFSLATDDAYLNNSPLSDHQPVSIKLNVSALAPLERVSKSFNFNKIDHEGLNRTALDSPFLPYCWTNQALLLALWHEWLKPLLNKFVTVKSVHRSRLPPWISPETSHLMKKLNTLESNPKLTTSYQTKLLSLKERVPSGADDDLCTYQACLPESRNSKHIFKQLKNLKKGAHLPLVLKNGADSAHSSLENAQMLNQYFHSVLNTKSSEPALPPEAFIYHPDSSFDTSVSKVTEILSNLDTSKATGADGLSHAFKKPAPQA